jgi:hypothetical protein
MLRNWDLRLAHLISVLLLFVSFSASIASAETIGWGIPVTGGGSNTAAGFAPGADHSIEFYIPLEAATSGVYGVTDTNGGAPGGLAGMFADTGDGSSGSYLDMWLKFQPVAPLPLATANLKFTFWDLDLAYINDPVELFETFQLFGSDGITPFSKVFTYAAKADGTISGVLDVNPSPSVTERINWTLTRALGSAGASAPSTLEFYGAALAARITDPFYAKLRFTVPRAPYGTNTAQYLTAKLTTTSRVPEPSSMLLLGLGFAVVAACRSRTLRA